ncbi:MAG TPA: AAA family ATPase [Melioribacteraceae bacterium]|nr:AAA family ATPase [Melioribacteraceae bacterium]
MEKVKENTLQQLAAYLETHNVSINRVSKQLGYSAAVLSQYLAGKYVGDNDKLEITIAAYLQRQKEIELMPKESIPFTLTTNAKQVFAIARMCHNENEIGVITGEAGTGKTRAIKEYSIKNPDVILIEADLSYTNKVFFRELHKKLGMDGNGGIYDLFTDCCERLKDSGRLVVIDEAENLPYRSLDMIRRLYDKAGIGILLVGLPRLIRNLTGRKGEFKQLYSRVGFAINLESLTDDDTKAIVTSVFPDLNGTSKVFCSLAKGNARKLEKLILRTGRIAKTSNSEVTERTINIAAEMLIL